MMGEQDGSLPALVTVRKPLSLIPVGLKEAALDSPPWRATTVHFADQLDSVERWLEGYVRAAGKLAQEVSVLEGLVGSFLTSSTPPSNLSEAVIDHDYTLLALQRYGEGAREHFTHTISGLKKTQSSVIDPIKSFLANDLRSFKETRKQLDATQKQYDNLLARYYSQAKTKEPSALREDAFQLHEARKAYLKCSMDFCIQAPQLHATLDALLIKVFSEQWLEMKGLRETSTNVFKTHGQEIERIRGWSKEMSIGDRNLKRELIMTRVQIEDRAEAASRPSRELDDYAASTVPFLGNRPPTSQLQNAGDIPASKQGWLFLRTISGKPARTYWIRRWFFVKNGIFGWMILGAKSGGVEESEKIGVLLCNVRPAFQEERRFCFEIKTKDATLMLQAETQADLTDWMSAFEMAKQKALDDPSSTEMVAGGPGVSLDSAFAVIPAIAPELAAKEGVSGNLPIPEGDNGSSSAIRHSIDVSGRDHASRLIQKLDLHRKSTAGAQLSSGSYANAPTPQNFGIASLINASHNALPMGLNRVDSIPQTGSGKQMDSSSLAPTTLVQPPAPTNLSKTALMIGAERGLDLGVVDSSGGVPSSIMGNQWGTVNYGHLSRLERGEVRTPQRSVSQATTIGRGSEPIIPGSETERMTDTPSEVGDMTSSGQSVMTGSINHRKTMSDTEAPVQRRTFGATADFPSFYPTSLKAHDAQMRILFPNVPSEERVVLVFRASWNPDERQDLPGRVFVTLNELYFYSHHYGFTLVSGVSLSRIIDVSIRRQEKHDFLYLEIEGRDEREARTSITVKTFLEPIKILQRRLKFLTSNCSAEEPQSLEEALRILINLDSKSQFNNPDSDSESESSPTRSNATRRRAGTTQSSLGLRVDRSLYGGDSAPFTDANDVLKFRLPTQPVLYAPKDMTEVAAEAVFDVSAKAMFHIMFGDKSAISQLLYRERRATNVTQYPWTSIGESRWSRNFEYEIDTEESSSQPDKVVLIDSQTVEIASDHLCYVVTDLKTPWHLPYARDFSLVSKIVITHVAKSKCQLRVFISVDWRKQPALSKNIIEKHAMDDLRLDAQDILNLVTDQVQKLGPNCYTKKAVEIFGHLGHQNEAATITVNDTAVVGRPARLAVTKRTMTALILETLGSFLSSAVSTIVMSIIGTVTGLKMIFTANALLTSFLIVSVVLNLQWSTETAVTWWHERNAMNLASRLGIGPNVALSRTIHLSEFNEIISPSTELTGEYTSKCSDAFRTILVDSDIASPLDVRSGPRSTAYRLRKTRQRLGIHRHDLMVALRMVNTLERETVQAEFEDWLLEESMKCEKIGTMLQPQDSSAGNGTQADDDGRELFARKLGADNAGNVKEWYREYCGSCFEERKALNERDARELRI